MDGQGSLLISPSERLRLRSAYPAGSRVRLIGSDDPYTLLTPGAEGTIDNVDDGGTIHIDWDGGERLGLIVGIDRFELIEEER